MLGNSLKRWFASAFGPTGFAHPFRRHLEWSLVPSLANACQNAFSIGDHGAWYGIAFACTLAAKNRELHSVQFLSDAGRIHRVAKHLQTLAQVLQAAERHITDRDMSPDPLWGPVIDGPYLDGVDTPTRPSEVLHRTTGVEHMLTKQENYRDPDAVA